MTTNIDETDKQQVPVVRTGSTPVPIWVLLHGFVGCGRYPQRMNVAQVLMEATPSFVATLWDGLIAAFASNPWPFLFAAAMLVLSSMVPARRRRRARY